MDTNYTYTVSNAYPRPLTFFGETVNTNDTMVIDNRFDRSKVSVDWVRIMALLKQDKLIMVSSNKVETLQIKVLAVETNLHIPLGWDFGPPKL